MTERVEPWSTTMIAWLRRSTPEHLEPHTLTQLADIAEDHARLVEENGRLNAIIRAGGETLERQRAELEQNREDWNALRAENAKLRERAEKFRTLEAQAAEHVEVQLLNRTDFDPDGEIVGWPGLGLALNRALDERDKLRERVGKLEAVEQAARKAWGMAAFPDQNYGLSDALAALDEEDGT